MKCVKFIGQTLLLRTAGLNYKVIEKKEPQGTFRSQGFLCPGRSPGSCTRSVHSWRRRPNNRVGAAGQFNQHASRGNPFILRVYIYIVSATIFRSIFLTGQILKSKKVAVFKITCVRCALLQKYKIKRSHDPILFCILHQ